MFSVCVDAQLKFGVHVSQLPTLIGLVLTLTVGKDRSTWLRPGYCRFVPPRLNCAGPTFCW